MDDDQRMALIDESKDYPGQELQGLKLVSLLPPSATAAYHRVCQVKWLVCMPGASSG